MAINLSSGASSDVLTIDPTSKAARVTLYDTSGNILNQKATYRAATTALFAAVAGTAPFFALYGSGTKTVRVQRVLIAGINSATLGVDRVNLAKYSTAITGGTPTALTLVPSDSNSSSSTVSLCNVYTAAPTAGAKVGDIASRAILAKSTTTADGSLFAEMVFDFRIVGESSAVVLRGITQGVALYFNVAPAAAANVQLEVEWTEE